MRAAGGPKSTGDWDWIGKVRGQDRYQLKRHERLTDVLSEVRVAGPPNAVPRLLFESTLRTNEDLSLLAVWSAQDQALKSDPYGAGAMRIIATGGLDQAVRTLRKEMALKAVKAVLALAAGAGLIWILSTRIVAIRYLLGVGQ